MDGFHVYIRFTFIISKMKVKLKFKMKLQEKSNI